MDKTIERLRTEDVEKVREKLESHVKHDLVNLFAVTGKLGVQTGNRRWYWENAKKAAETKKYQKEGKDVYWVPLYWNEQFIAVCGLKGYKAFPKEEAVLLEGLVNEIVYDQFLENQINSILTPRSNFIKELLETDRFKTMEEAIDRGDIIDINLRAPQAVILIKLPGYFKSLQEKYKDKPAENLPILITRDSRELMYNLGLAFENYEQNIFGRIDTDMFVCLKWARGDVNTLNSINFFRTKANFLKEKIEKLSGFTATIGVGQYYPGLSGLRKSYNDAKIALEIGSKIWGEGRAYHITDIGMFISFSHKIDFERKCELSYQIMGKIFSDNSLYKTVNVFLENDMNLSEAAAKLHLHRNTLIYRLDKIKKTIGLDPRKFSDAVQIKLGLVLFSPTIRCQNDKS